jgi:hypothetical protein
MSAHATHTMHRHSLAANRTVARQTWNQRILAVYAYAPLTDREVADRLGVHVSEVRPRITDLIQGNDCPVSLVELEETVKCEVTGRPVRLTRPVSNPPQEPQP